MFCDNKVISQLDLGELPDKIVKWAQENIREDADTRCQILDEFRDMIYARGECTPIRMDDGFLLRFLRGRNYSIESAYRLFLNHHDFREENPNYFKGVGLSLLHRLGPHDILTVPPYREQTGRRMLLYKIGNWNMDLFTVDEIMAASILVLELALIEERSQIFGGVCLFDFSNITLQHAWQMTPTIAKTVVKLMTTVIAFKVLAVHVLFQPRMFDAIFSVVRPFVNEKSQERLFFHGSDMQSLHKHIDPEHLPQKYGGIHPTYNYRDWLDWFESNKTIMTELKMLGYSVDNEEEHPK